MYGVLAPGARLLFDPAATIALTQVDLRAVAGTWCGQGGFFSCSLRPLETLDQEIFPCRSSTE